MREAQVPKPELRTSSSSLPRSARLRSRCHISPQLQNSCLHFSEPGSSPDLGALEPGLGWIAWACSPPAHFSLDSHFHPGQRRGRGRMQKLDTESPAGISPASHSRARLGKEVALARSSCSGRAGALTRPRARRGVPGRCHPPRRLEPPTAPRRSPLPGGRAAARAGAQQSSGTLREKPGQWGEEDPCLRFPAGKSWREPEPSGTSRRSFPPL